MIDLHPPLGTLLATAPLAGAVGAAALSGLIGSPHCVGMCGGFGCAAGGAQGFAAWTLGRLLTYSALGAAVGALGARLPGPGWLGTALAGAALLLLSLQLGGLLPALPARGPLARLGAAAAALLRRPGTLARLGFGALTGLLPCGLVWAALSAPLVAGGAAGGALSMFAFGLGTTPALALVAGGVQRLAVRSPAHRRALALGVLLLGALSLGGRVALAQP